MVRENFLLGNFLEHLPTSRSSLCASVCFFFDSARSGAMRTLNLRLSDSMHARLKEWAKKDDISINQLVATAVAEKLAALTTVEYLEARAKRASKEKFDEVLARVADADVGVEDKWPAGRL
jgi:predicted DNA-binding ribbon-helix-helix protein